MGTDRHSPRAVCQVTDDDQLGRRRLNHWRTLLESCCPIPSDQDLLIQRLMGVIRPSQPVVQERSKLTDLEIMLQNWLPVGTVTEEDVASPNSLSDSLEGCFSCGALTHTTDQCQTLDESFPFLADGMASGLHRRPVHPGTGASSGAPEPVDGKRRLIRGEGLVTRISDDYEPQLPVGEDIPGPAVSCHVGTARLLETVDRWTMVVGRDFRLPCSDSDDSDVICRRT